MLTLFDSIFNRGKSNAENKREDTRENKPCEKSVGSSDILFYGKSLVGLSHIQRNIPCQDYSKAIILSNGCCVAAVADGVGSAKHSQVASKLAVETTLDVIRRNLTESKLSTEEVQKIVFAAYAASDKIIQDYAEAHEHSVTDYDTTLSCVVYDGKRVVYGHSGDGGIIGLKTDGEYIRITTPQKGDDGISVIPLRAGKEHWVIDCCSDEFASVLLATDGVYDTFFPYLLKGQSTEIYVRLVMYFMDGNLLSAEQGIAEIEQSRIEYLTSDAYSSVQDDKTVLVLINPTVKPAVYDVSYYAEPDWQLLQQEWNKRAYPHLYNDKSTDKTDVGDK